MANGPTIPYTGGQRFEDTSPSVFDNPLEKLIRKGKRGANWLADLLLGSTPEEEMQTAMESFLSPMATAQGIGRRVLSNVAGPTRRRLLSPPQEITAYHGSPASSFPPTTRNPLGEFDLGKIGTGEGSQMYGQGMYSSAERPIGETYRQMYAPYRPPRSGYTHPEGVTAWRQRYQGTEELPTIPNTERIPHFDKPMGYKTPQTFSDNPVIDLDEVRQASMKAADNLNMAGLNAKQFNPHYGQLDIGAALRFVEDKVTREGIPAEDIMEVAGRGGNVAPKTDFQRAMNPHGGGQVGTSSKSYWGRSEDDYVRDYKNLLEAVIEPWKGLTPTYFPGERLGSLFEVGIKASPEELIDLGKPLTGQSSQVQSAVRSIFDPLQRQPILPEASSKAEQMRLFRKFKDAQEAVSRARYGTETSYPSPLFANPEEALNAARTQLLRDRGVPGAQYLGHSSGKRNYVIWDPERLNILRKLAAGVGMVGTGTAAASQAPGTTGQN